jgi:hypothetical protein
VLLVLSAAVKSSARALGRKMRNLRKTGGDGMTAGWVCDELKTAGRGSAFF